MAARCGPFDVSIELRRRRGPAGCFRVLGEEGVATASSSRSLSPSLSRELGQVGCQVRPVAPLPRRSSGLDLGHGREPRPSEALPRVILLLLAALAGGRARRDTGSRLPANHCGPQSMAGRDRRGAFLAPSSSSGSGSGSGRRAPEHEWWPRSPAPAWSRPLSDSGGARGRKSGSSTSSSSFRSLFRSIGVWFSSLSTASPSPASSSMKQKSRDAGAKKPPCKSTRPTNSAYVPSLFNYAMAKN